MLHHVLHHLLHLLHHLLHHLLCPGIDAALPARDAAPTLAAQPAPFPTAAERSDDTQVVLALQTAPLHQ